MTEVDPDPREPAEGTSELGGAEVPSGGDPTQGGKRGEIGEAPSVTADEPDDGESYPVGGGRTTPDL